MTKKGKANILSLSAIIPTRNMSRRLGPASKR